MIQLYHYFEVVCTSEAGLHAVHGSEGIMTVDSVKIADGDCREVNLARTTFSASSDLRLEAQTCGL